MREHSLAQLRARHALQAVEALVARGPAGYGQYVSYVQALPASIRSLGLGQALAFLLAKAEGNPGAPHGLLYGHVESWLRGRNILDAPDAAGRSLMDLLTGGRQEQYLRAQVEAMAYLEWLKKFAVALLDKPPEREDA
jgi:CRISPR-associated protein Cmr5